MVKNLKYLIAFIPLFSIAQWHMDFDEDFAAASQSYTNFKIQFLTGVFPSQIVLGSTPANPSLSEIDCGDGVWKTFSNRTNILSGSYFKFRGDWRTSEGTYQSMFSSTLQSSAYTCEFSGSFKAYPAHANAYREMFYNATSVKSIVDNPIPNLVGTPGVNMFYSTFQNMSEVTGSLPVGFLNTSGLTGSPAANMFYCTCWNMTKVTGSLPSNFLNTSGLTGSPAANMFNTTCTTMSGVTGPLPAGFMDTHGLTGSPAANMFAYACGGMTKVTGSLPANFLNTSGLTGSPASSMFLSACGGMSGVTGSLPANFLNTSGLTGTPSANMFYSTCLNMSGVTSGDFYLGSNITFTASNIVGTTNALYRMCYNMPKWSGNVWWGTNLIVNAIPTPASSSQAFYNCTNMPNYNTINANWK